MNIQANQIERIKELGYTEAEARFIYLVAVHDLGTSTNLAPPPKINCLPTLETL